MAMGPAVDAISEEFRGRAAVAKVNVDLCPEIADRFSIRAVPTVIFFRNGEAVEVVAGARSKEDLAKKLTAHLH
jgi:thioredoxin 1